MKFLTHSNIIPLFRGVVDAIQPYAKSNQLNLIFKQEIQELIVEYHPETIIHDVTQLLCNIIAFTPQSYNIVMELDEIIYNEETFLKVEVKNNGANLSRISEITAHLNNKVIITPLKKSGTLYQMYVPYKIPEIQKSKNLSKINHHGIPAYYAQIKNKLRSHFAKPENLERAASSKNQSDGVFLQKINALIMSNLGEDDFNTDSLCKGIALSRSQLYRKLKSLTCRPPAHYIQYFRLQKAKEYLQNTDLNVGEVVFKVGFASHSHFTRAFNDQFGFNPSFLKKISSEKGT